jgi:hypothetical protein
MVRLSEASHQSESSGLPARCPASGSRAIRDESAVLRHIVRLDDDRLARAAQRWWSQPQTDRSEGRGDRGHPGRKASPMIELDYEMTFRERIEGPLGPTVGAPARLVWQITEASLTGPRISATLAMPGTDWIRLGSDGIRRQDQRAQFVAADGALILLRYDTGLIRGDGKFLDALEKGEETGFGDQYMFMVPQFEVASDRYDWLTRSVFLAQGRLVGPKQIEYAVHRVA